jgi:DNA polymerase-3 subunit delta
MPFMEFQEFIARVGKGDPPPVCAVFGDEDFLKRQAIAAIKTWALGPDEESMGLAAFPGDKAVWSTVLGELQTLPFLCPRRLVVIENADPFVTAHRAQLEDYVAAPARCGVLVLDVKTWASNTKLYKLLEKSGNISCKALTGAKVVAWCRDHCTNEHQKQLSPPAAQMLVDLVGADLGLLAQEIAKLAVYVGESARIEPADVDKLVGNSRDENTFKIFDMIGAGQVGPALALLGHLVAQGEEPLRLLGAFGWQLRRVVQVARLAARGRPLGDALAQAGLPPFKAREIEQLLRHLGRQRIDQMYDWLLETDLGMKGGSELPPRVILERLVIRLAMPATKLAAVSGRG